MASISTLGIGSGLKLGDILESLTTAEKASLKPISTQQSAYTAKLSAYGTLKSALTTFQTANTALSKADLFSASKASTASTSFSATTSAGAVAGKYSINVTQLASAQTLTAGVQSDNKTAIASADSTITFQPAGADAKPVTITLAAGDSSLTGIRDAINKADAGVTASIIKTGEGAYRLSMTSTKTGADQAMTISVSGDSALESYLATSGGNLTESVAAKNAELTVNNVAIESSSNNISDALEGITLNLSAVTAGNQTLTITEDREKASTAISAWVDAYNALQDSFSSLTKYTEVEAGAETQDSKNGALLGDSTLRTIQTQMKGLLTNSDSASAYKTLAQIGVTSNPTSGKLELDKTKLDAALAKDPDGVKEMIVGDGKATGITTQINTSITGWLSKTGILQAATDGVSKTLNNLTESYNAASKRIDATIARYKAQFTNLDKMMSQLNSTSDYLTTQFDALISSSKK